MSITSYSFFVMTAAALLLYYIIPKKHRWAVLLCATLLFVFASGSAASGLAAVGMVLFAWGAGLLLSRTENPKAAKGIVSASVAGLAAALLACKEQQFFIGSARLLSFGALNLDPIDALRALTPLGISYFTLTLISYVCGVYWRSFEAERNPLRLMTYSLFFPTLTSGPILKYGESAPEILGGKDFDYTGFCFGLQRICWGFFKKLVVSERLARIVDPIYADYASYGGACILFAVWMFALQLYTDFSGCIDIALGVSELFGIHLPENFELPFCSRTLSEFWRRWHITLGGWLKEYILYPILKSDLFQAIGERAKKKFGKKTGKKIPVWLGLLVSWFLIGLWHGGGFNYIFGVGLFMGIVIIAGEMLEPAFKKMKKALKINENSFLWITFQRVRTFLFFSFGLSFFRAKGLKECFRMWARCFSGMNFHALLSHAFLPKISNREMAVFVVSLGILAVAGVLRMIAKEPLRNVIARRNIVLRWALYIALLWIVVVFGVYGPGYDAASFIYERF